MSLLNSHNEELGGGSENRGFSRGGGLMKSLRRSIRRLRRPPRQAATATAVPPVTSVSETQAVLDAGTRHKPPEFLEDEIKVKQGTCQFKVKYLGVLEVKDSRGVAHCEEAVKRHKQRKERNKTRALLCISPETIRLVKEKNKQLIIDQTIEKVSFCAPDSTYEKGFSYICRDGATKRWMCYSFTAINGTGERISHAVGTAFQACLAKKQEMEKANMTLKEQSNETAFTEPVVEPNTTTANNAPASPVVNAMRRSTTTPDDDVDNDDDNGGGGETSTQAGQKIKFEIKPLPRPQAPEHLKRQASLRAFVPSPKQDAFKTSKSARTFAPSLAEKFRGKEALNPVPEIESNSPPRTTSPPGSKPVQSVAPFTRGQAAGRATIAAGQVRRQPAQPIREVNPWGQTESTSNSMIRSSTEPAGFDAFGKMINKSSNRQQPPISNFQRTVTQSQSFNVKHRGDEWMDALIATHTGGSTASTVSSSARSIPPVIPKRTGAAAQSFRFQQQQRVTQQQQQPQFQRSQSVRYGSSGLSSTSSSPNPFHEAPFPALPSTNTTTPAATATNTTTTTNTAVAKNTNTSTTTATFDAHWDSLKKTEKV